MEIQMEHRNVHVAAKAKHAGEYDHNDDDKMTMKRVSEMRNKYQRQAEFESCFEAVVLYRNDYIVEFA